MANYNYPYSLAQEQIRHNDLQLFEYDHRQPISTPPSPKYSGLQHRHVQSQEGSTFLEHRAQMPSSHHGHLAPAMSRIGVYGLNNHRHVQSQEGFPIPDPRADLPSLLDGNFSQRMTGIDDYGLVSSQNTARSDPIWKRHSKLEVSRPARLSRSGDYEVPLHRNMPGDSSWRNPANRRTDPDPARRLGYRSERLSGMRSRNASVARRPENRFQQGFYTGYRKRYDKNLRMSRARDIPTAKENPSRYKWFPVDTSARTDHQTPSSSRARQASPKKTINGNEGTRASTTADLTEVFAPTSRAPTSATASSTKQGTTTQHKQSGFHRPEAGTTRQSDNAIAPRTQTRTSSSEAKANPITKRPRSTPKDPNQNRPHLSKDPHTKKLRSPPKDPNKNGPRFPSKDPNKSKPHSLSKDPNKKMPHVPSNDPDKNGTRSPSKDLNKARPPIPSKDSNKNRPQSQEDPTVAPSVPQRHATPLSRKRHLPNAAAPVSPKIIKKQRKPSGEHTAAAMVGDQPDRRSSRNSTEQEVFVAAAERSCLSPLQPVKSSLPAPLPEERHADRNAASVSTETNSQPANQSIAVQTNEWPILTMMPYTKEGVRKWQDALKNIREMVRKTEAHLENIRKHFSQ
ncbi:serine/arginine repetitive matrix protein 5-like [Littorina saxatilis]|uniref:serine/arginine repetitive matrix protein 5-like n=1 Tax=Littorina saxatilis TaxID=31220 RepID=UPI0038B501A1